MLTGVPLVGVTRGPRLESAHALAACACDVNGNVVLEIGTIDEPFFLRSAAKPFIAAAAVRAGVAERFGFDDCELAVMSASHNGEPFHVATVASILAKIGATPADLRCGAHAPLFAPAAAALRAAGTPPTALHNNCSGKHAGILALARMLDAPLSGYLGADHPAQRAIREFCQRMSDDVFSADKLGIDGCGIPVYATSLRNAARSFARLATLEQCDRRDASALARVREAIVAQPRYLAGTGRFDTDLIRASNGSIVAKGGAEGVQATALIDSGLGLVLKVIDGATRAAAPGALLLLEALGAIDPRAREALGSHARAAVTNHAGTIVGEISALAPVTAN